MLMHHRISITTMEDVYNTVDTPTIATDEDAERNTEEIGAVAEVLGATVI